MKKVLFTVIFIHLSHLFSFSQTRFSEEVRKYIEYDTANIALRNALLIDGKGSAAKPRQTIIISKGKIAWMGYYHPHLRKYSTL